MNQQFKKSYSPLIDYCLHLADNALVLGHRNSEWCGHGPVLEQDIALTNIALDLIGQARNFYQYAAERINNENAGNGSTITEDTLAYLREADEFRNVLLVEIPNGDWGHTILRQFFFSTYQYFLYAQLQEGTDEQIAAIAVKSLKEVTYHLRWSSEWVIRLGDGTAESHRRMKNALTELWPYTQEFFTDSAFEKGMKLELKSIAAEWMNKTSQVFQLAKLDVPALGMQHSGGKFGVHSEELFKLLSEMQILQRTYPGAEW